MVNLPWVWTGLFGNNFDNALDWVVPLAPGALSDCEILLTAPTSVMAGNETINSLSTVASVTLNIAANAAFTIIGEPDSVIPTGDSNIGGKMMLDAGAHLNLGGLFNLRGELDIAAGSAVLVDGKFVDTGTVRQIGTVTLGDATHGGGITNSASATWVMSGGAAILRGSAAPNMGFVNAGLLDQGGGHSYIQVAAHNTGTIKVLGGELDLLGGVTNNGTMKVTNGVLSVSAVDGVGAIEIQENGVLTIHSGATHSQIVNFNSSSTGTELLNLGHAGIFADHITGFGAGGRHRSPACARHHGKLRGWNPDVDEPCDHGCKPSPRRRLFPFAFLAGVRWSRRNGDPLHLIARSPLKEAGPTPGLYETRRGPLALSGGLQLASLSVDCCFPLRTGSDAYLVKPASSHANDTRFEQVDLSAPVHLSFDKLELADLALGLAIRPC